MKKVNGKKPQRLHTAQKAAGSKLTPSGRRKIKLALSLAAFLCALAAATVAYRKMRRVWEDQCVVEDVKGESGGRRTVTVSATPHISEENVFEWFGLTNGCNLAKIDFDGMRKTVMRERPIVRDVQITRRLPDGVDIVLSERIPVARVNIRRRRVGKGVRTTWDAVDAEGVVFLYNLGDSAHLPLITGETSPTPQGEKLSGRLVTALAVVERLARLEYAPLSLEESEISVADGTYLTISLSDHKLVKISWRLIDQPDGVNGPNLEHILGNVRDAVASKLYDGPYSFTASNLDQVAVEQTAMPAEEVSVQ
ncbi:MAG: FtsQ-type POTRA domain-containing protein [Kiritimatiellae bacterium]|nr:FtsQ-type POTRA domain-containing protein [Kiritimatiellia bacterium]